MDGKPPAGRGNGGGSYRSYTLQPGAIKTPTNNKEMDANMEQEWSMDVNEEVVDEGATKVNNQKENKNSRNGGNKRHLSNISMANTEGETEAKLRKAYTKSSSSQANTAFVADEESENENEQRKTIVAVKKQAKRKKTSKLASNVNAKNNYDNLCANSSKETYIGDTIQNVDALGRESQNCNRERKDYNKIENNIDVGFEAKTNFYKTNDNKNSDDNFFTLDKYNKPIELPDELNQLTDLIEKLVAGKSEVDKELNKKLEERRRSSYSGVLLQTRTPTNQSSQPQEIQPHPLIRTSRLIGSQLRKNSSSEQSKPNATNSIFRAESILASPEAHQPETNQKQPSPKAKVNESKEMSNTTEQVEALKKQLQQLEKLQKEEEEKIEQNEYENLGDAENSETEDSEIYVTIVIKHENNKYKQVDEVKSVILKQAKIKNNEYEIVRNSDEPLTYTIRIDEERSTKLKNLNQLASPFFNKCELTFTPAKEIQNELEFQQKKVYYLIVLNRRDLSIEEKSILTSLGAHEFRQTNQGKPMIGFKHYETFLKHLKANHIDLLTRGKIRVQKFVRCFPFRYCWICKNSGHTFERCNQTVNKRKIDNHEDCEKCAATHIKGNCLSKPYCTSCKAEHRNGDEDNCPHTQKLHNEHNEKMRKKIKDAKFKSIKIQKNATNPTNTVVVEQTDNLNKIVSRTKYTANAKAWENINGITGFPPLNTNSIKQSDKLNEEIEILKQNSIKFDNDIEYVKQAINLLLQHNNITIPQL